MYMSIFGMLCNAMYSIKEGRKKACIQPHKEFVVAVVISINCLKTVVRGFFTSTAHTSDEIHGFNGNQTFGSSSVQSALQKTHFALMFFMTSCMKVF